MFFDKKKKPLRTAFDRIKTDMYHLGEEVSMIKQEMLELKNLVRSLENSLNSLNTASTHSENTSTHTVSSTDTSTVPYEIGGLKYPNFNSSSGNEGVSTDRQTVRQTDIQHIKPINESLNEASEMIESLDNLKEEIKQKFLSLTQQEILVFSTIYQLQEQAVKDIDYHKLALKLGLSQSSIRDYVQRIINKGISIEKTKLNNKKIILSIPLELTKIASLQAILQLRDL